MELFIGVTKCQAVYPVLWMDNCTYIWFIKNVKPFIYKHNLSIEVGDFRLFRCLDCDGHILQPVS